MTFILTYITPLDRSRVVETLCADSHWTSEQVAQAFLRHHPNAELISCTPQP